MGYFKAIGCRNPPRAAKFKGGVSKPEAEGGTPRKRRNNGVSCKKAHGGEDLFLFRVDRERACAAEHAKAKPPGIIAHCDGLGNAGAPKAM